MQEETEQKNEAWSVSRKRTAVELLAVTVSALLASSAFPPFDFSFAVWFALVPLYMVLITKKPLKAMFIGYYWGYIWSTIVFNWLREIEPFIPYAISFIIALFPASWAFFVPLFKKSILIPIKVQLEGADSLRKYKTTYSREILFIVALSAAWCFVEWIRSWFISGFPWNFIGASQWQNIPVIQICEYTGVYGVSFIIIFFNIALAFTLTALNNALHGKKYKRPIPFIAAIGLLMAAVLFGAKPMMKYHLPLQQKSNKKNSSHIRFTPAVIQGDIPQCRFPKGGEAENALTQYIKLSKLAILNRPDIVIWSETAVPVPYRTGYPFGDLYRFELFKLLKSGIPFMIGSIDYNIENLKPGTAPSDIKCYNAVLLLHIKAKNNFFLKEKYYKIHLVPYGEYTPLGKYIPVIKKMFGMGRDLTPGKRYTIFNLKDGVRAGANICYEDIFPEISANFARRGANVIIVLTNDAWYPTSSESEQHLANSIFRAIETRLPMIRAGNNGCSCLILPNGVIADSVSVKKDGTPAPFKQSRGFACFQIDLEKSPQLTFHTQHPFLFVWLCSLIFTLSVLQTLYIYSAKRKAVSETRKK